MVLIIENIYFKLHATNEVVEYSINIEWTCKNFYENICPLLRNHFQILAGKNIKLFDANISINRTANSCDWEEFDKSSTEYLKDYFNNNFKNICFYVDYTTSELLEEREEVEIEAETQSLLTCIVCLTMQRRILFMPCNHLCSCENCGTNELLTNCPICRSNIVTRIPVFIS